MKGIAYRYSWSYLEITLLSRDFGTMDQVSQIPGCENLIDVSKKQERLAFSLSRSMSLRGKPNDRIDTENIQLSESRLLSQKYFYQSDEIIKDKYSCYLEISFRIPSKSIRTTNVPEDFFPLAVSCKVRNDEVAVHISVCNKQKKLPKKWKPTISNPKSLLLSPRWMS
jgi:hypothetical protein